MNKPIIGIIYDFDRTLSKEDLQNFSFIPSLGMTPAEFWQIVNEFSQKNSVEKILSYMYVMIDQARKKGIKLTKNHLRELGRKVVFYPGVLQWFDRINAFAREQGIEVEHYIVSSGNKEIIEGTSIAKEFKAIFGCEYLFSEVTGEPIWPKLAINYTMKTQYFFRIAKGVLSQSDDKRVNQRSKEKRIPYRNIVYIGDGMTDVPSMVLVKENGGKSIAVYSEADQDISAALVDDGRINYVCKADYRSNSELDKVMKLIIQQVSITEELVKKEAVTNK